MAVRCIGSCSEWHISMSDVEVKWDYIETKDEKCQAQRMIWIGTELVGLVCKKGKLRWFDILNLKTMLIGTSFVNGE